VFCDATTDEYRSPLPHFPVRSFARARIGSVAVDDPNGEPIVTVLGWGSLIAVAPSLCPSVACLFSDLASFQFRVLAIFRGALRDGCQPPIILLRYPLVSATLRSVSSTPTSCLGLRDDTTRTHARISSGLGYLLYAHSLLLTLDSHSRLSFP
jgi:hypothetical protein